MKTNLSMLKAYPIGSIYISTNNISPAFLFGGSWEELKDHATLMTDSSATLGNYSGNNTMSVEQMPKHNHTFSRYYGTDDNNFSGHISNAVEANDTSSLKDDVTTSSVGGDQPFYPYHMSVKMWRRTA